jgi:hypothetical protein
MRRLKCAKPGHVDACVEVDASKLTKDNHEKGRAIARPFFFCQQFVNSKAVCKPYE